jgi:hypothetical protein
LAKRAQAHEKDEVATFINAKKIQKAQKSAQEYENKGRMVVWLDARFRKCLKR